MVIKDIKKKVLSKIFSRRKDQWNESYSILYHLLDEQRANNIEDSSNLHSIFAQHLYEQLKEIKKNTSFLPVEEHIDVIRTNKDYKSVISVTIDDGYKASLDVGSKIFKDLDIPVTYFINTCIIEKGVFWRDKIRYVINNNLVEEFLTFACDNDKGFEAINHNNFYRESKNPVTISSQKVDMMLDKFLRGKVGFKSDDIYLSVNDLKKEPYFTWGNHTNNHYVLSSLSKSEQLNEISYVEKFFEREGISYSNVFSIPFGNDITFNDDTLELLIDLGYKGVVLSSGYTKKSVNEFTERLKKFDIGIINRFMPKNTPSIFH